MPKPTTAAAPVDEMEILPAELEMMANEPPIEGIIEGIGDGTNDVRDCVVEDNVILPPPTLGHALDDAPLLSSIVIVKLENVLKAVLSTPVAQIVLDANDPASKLPEGAKITKRAEGKFVSIQLSPVEDHHPLVTTSTLDAIARFVGHFHNGTNDPAIAPDQGIE